MISALWSAVILTSSAVSLVYLVKRCMLSMNTSSIDSSNDTTHQTACKHITLSSPELKSTVLIIGDVHGCLDELKALLDEADYDSSTMSVILVGDLVSKGPFSSQVIAFVHKNGFYCVLGNHDIKAISHYNEYISTSIIHDKYKFLLSLTPDDIHWFTSLPHTISIPEYNSIIVHAGLIPHMPLSHQSEETMTTMRNIYYNPKSSITYEPLERNSKGDNWAQFWKSSPHVYYGHDAKRGLQYHEYATGLDTGCCYGRKLSGMLLPERRLVEVEALMVYEDKDEKRKRK